MVGDDVVDLGDPECSADARHPRFDARVFTARERRLLERPGASPSLRWILWAAKESAYKVARRADAHVVFAPRRFEVTLDVPDRGRVEHGQHRYPVRIEVGDRFVHAVAIRAGLPIELVWHGVREIAEAEAGDPTGASPGRIARAFALERVAAHMSVAQDSLAIEQRRRIPVLVDRNGREAAWLSLSHHGRFVAFASARIIDLARSAA